MIRRMLALAAAGLFVFVAAPASAQSDVYGSTHHAYRAVTVVEGLERPWSMTFKMT